MPAIDYFIQSHVLRFFLLLCKLLFVYIKAIVGLFTTAKRKSIRGQNVLITGGGGGLGRELALRFAAEGANLILVDMNEKNLKVVKDEIIEQEQNNVKVLDYIVDIRSDKNITKLAEDVRSDIGDVDILVNNAGIVQCLPFLELSPQLIERTFQVNIFSHIWTMREFLPKMMEKNHGHIVAISSIAGLIGNKYLTDYCASKFAVVGLMQALDKELHDKSGKDYDNIHLTTVCPSSMTTKMFQTFTTRFSWILPVMKPENVANMIVDSILENRKIVVIPKFALVLYKLSMFVPRESVDLVQDYLDYGVKPHKC